MLQLAHKVNTSVFCRDGLNTYGNNAHLSGRSVSSHMLQVKNVEQMS